MLQRCESCFMTPIHKFEQSLYFSYCSYFLVFCCTKKSDHVFQFFSYPSCLVFCCVTSASSWSSQESVPSMHYYAFCHRVSVLYLCGNFVTAVPTHCVLKNFIDFYLQILESQMEELPIIDIKVHIIFYSYTLTRTFRCV